MKSNAIIIPLLVLGYLSLTPLSAQADKTDRSKPVNLEADRITVDETKKVHILEGNVQLVQGTLMIRCDKLVVTQDGDGFQKGTATGGPGGLARFKQRRDGKEEYIDGEAERIVHDGKAERTEFFQRARIKSGSDEVRGQYIAYDGKTENYLVTSGPPGASGAATAGKDTRVRAVIQPKSKAGEQTPSAPSGQPATEAAPAPL